MNIGNKRKDTMQGDNKPKRVKKECDYGERCSIRNPAHFREFKHKHLDSILDAYTGEGDYPIPDKYVLERLAIIEQLDVIVVKELYTPWKDKTTVKDTGEATSSTRVNNNNERTHHSNASNSSEVSSRRSYRNDESSSKDEGSSSKNEGLSSKDEGSSSKDEGSSSKNEGLSSINVESRSKNLESRCQNVESRSKNEGSNSKNYGSTSKIERSSNNEGTSRNNAVSSNKNERPKNENISRNTEDSSNQNAAILDYTKVPPTRRVQDFLNVDLERQPANKMADKHAASAPYHIFYTTINASRETHQQNNSITFLEILDRSLGELKCSLQINFVVELGWLLDQYYSAGYSEKRLTILYGEVNKDLRSISQKKPHIDAHRVAMSSPFGSHHTKMMILYYEDGSLRVVISTANLYLDDWKNRTQGLWFSPACPRLPAGAAPSAGESATGFKRSLLQYLHHYRLPALARHLDLVKGCDFSAVNVFLCASVPGSHSEPSWGLTRAGDLLLQHAEAGPGRAAWPLLAQASSIGSYGAQAHLWLTGDFRRHLTRRKGQSQILQPPPELKLIYPSLENVRQSHDGLLGGDCLPYKSAVHVKQPWLNGFLYQWKATSTHRNQAMPHIKSYTRISPDNKMAAYFLLTSANCSKAAWGSVNKSNGALRIMSYEAGVLLLPRFVVRTPYRYPIGIHLIPH